MGQYLPVNLGVRRSNPSYIRPLEDKTPVPESYILLTRDEEFFAIWGLSADKNIQAMIKDGWNMRVCQGCDDPNLFFGLLFMIYGEVECIKVQDKQGTYLLCKDGSVTDA